MTDAYLEAVHKADRCLDRVIDIIAEGPRHQRAFLANYQTVGYLEDGVLVELRPQRRWRLVDPDSGNELPASPRGEELLEEAISYYEGAAEAYRSGILRRDQASGG
jgi:hypothetical protein